jgi:UPF0176 protein
MPLLHNRIDRKQLKMQIQHTPEKRVTLSFYKYHPIPEPNEFRDALFIQWSKIGVLGRTYIATEGINAQISVPEEHFEQFKKELYEIDWLNGVRLNIAVQNSSHSFFVLDIKVRKKIVADGIEDERFDASNIGIHLTAEEFNMITSQPDTILIDMRNHYESEVGHFEGAICPDVDTFRDSLPIINDMLQAHKDKNIVMYCTGGIRCEKASAYLKYKGFEKVYQLEGGIIEYARQVKAKGLPNKFIGKNFVFDERLGERISDTIIARCHQCGKPCDTHTNCKNDACHLLFIQCEECATKYEGCCTPECQSVIHLPKEVQKELRKGVNKGRQVFKKGRAKHLIEQHQ